LGPAGHAPGAERVLGDKAYSSRANRALLRGRGVIAVIPEPADQQVHHNRRGQRGGRPVDFDPETYKGRNVVERPSIPSINGAASGTDLPPASCLTL
jgi:hypothetical protein